MQHPAAAGLAVMLALTFFASTAVADVPEHLTYHGNLSTASGEAYTGVVETTFRIFDAETEGQQIWSEDMDAIDVLDGSFTAHLGTFEPLDEVFDGGSYWLEIEIEGQTLTPRTAVTSVPYALRAANAADAQTVQGMSPEEFSAGDVDAAQVSFDNSASGLDAADVQAALDELASLRDEVEALQSQIANLPTQAEVDANATAISDLTSDVSSNSSSISSLQSSVNSHSSSISGLQSSISSHSSDISGLQSTTNSQSSSISALQSDANTMSANISSNAGAISDLETLTQDMSRTTVGGEPSVIFEDINVYIRNGMGMTETTNSRGNLFIGYSEAGPDGVDREGSHNLIVGTGHNFTEYGGIVAGENNTISASYASVLGGTDNAATAISATVTGGRGNVASGTRSSVTGGLDNVAEAGGATVTGGLPYSAAGRTSPTARKLWSAAAPETPPAATPPPFPAGRTTRLPATQPPSPAVSSTRPAETVRSCSPAMIMKPPIPTRSSSAAERTTTTQRVPSSPAVKAINWSMTISITTGSSSPSSGRPPQTD
jgi:hypothetical protein